MAFKTITVETSVLNTLSTVYLCLDNFKITLKSRSKLLCSGERIRSWYFESWSELLSWPVWCGIWDSLVVCNSVGVDRCSLWKRKNLAQLMFSKSDLIKITKINWRECQAVSFPLLSVMLTCQKSGNVHYLKMSF